MGNGRYTESGKKKAQRVNEILQERDWGMTQYEIMVEMGIGKGCKGGMESALASLQHHGVLVSEDERGRIWLFEERYYSTSDLDRWR